jgi:hypothetical protein
MSFFGEIFFGAIFFGMIAPDEVNCRKASVIKQAGKSFCFRVATTSG